MSSRIVRWREATGVAVGADRVVAVTLAWMPAAPVTIARHEVPLAQGGLAAALASLAETGALSGRVRVGLDARAVFFITRPRQAAGDLDVAGMLESQFVAARPEGGLVGDAAVVKVRGGNYVSLAACRRSAALEVQEGLRTVAHDRRRLEPAPFALHALAQRAAAAPRPWRTVVRVLVDGARGLALLSRGRVPLAWRPFAVAKGREEEGVAAAVRGLVAHARGDLEAPSVDGVLLHVPAELASLPDAVRELCRIDARSAPPVALDDDSVARGLACEPPVHPVPNLLGQLRPQLTWRQRFPVGAALGMAAAVLVAWQSLAGSTSAAQGRVARAKARIAAATKTARAKQSELKAARAAARHEAELVARFVVRRARWATILRELPGQLPESAVLVGFTGRDQLVLPSLDKPDEKVQTVRDLSIQGELRVKKDEAAPEDVAAVLDGIARFEELLEACPRVDGAEVTRHAGKEGDVASFVVRCGSKR